MMKHIHRQGIVLFLLIILVLTGCMYPNERRLENQVPHMDQLELIQKAVLTYKEKTGVLPIKTKEADTPLYEKYVVDFQQLINLQLLSSLPGHSFESEDTTCMS